MAIHPGSIWLEKNWSQLPRDSWVAASGVGIVTTKKVLEDVYADLKRKEIKLMDVTIAYITDGVIQ